MKGCTRFAGVFLLLLSACSVKNADYFGGALDTNMEAREKQGVSNEKALRQNYCGELFLAEGFDVSSDQKGPGLTENVATYKDAYQLCLDLTGKKDAASGSAEGYFPTVNLGLALSGGGTRSGSFSLGVLKGLNDIEISKDGKSKGESLLTQVDTISSVSGGGYAAYWYLMQNYYRDPVMNGGGDIGASIDQVQDDIFRAKNDDNIVKDTKYQDHLTKSSDLAHARQSARWYSLEESWVLLGHIFTVPVHLVANGLFEWHTNTSAFAFAYKQGIERAYGLSTKKDFSPFKSDCNADCQYYNAKKGRFAFWNDEAQVDAVSFDQYRDFLRERNSLVHKNNGENEQGVANPEFIHPLPYPIINTTMGTSTFSMPFEPLDRSVYSFTPLNYGSGLGGYVNNHENQSEVSLSKAFAISGAAIDANATDGNWFYDILLWGMDANLGYRYPNVSNNTNPVTLTLNKAFHYILPVGIYHAHDLLTPAAYQASYRLSDGGQSENLGLYSLIKRGAKHVIVVDAGQDNDYEFDDLGELLANIEQMKLSASFENGKNLSAIRGDGNFPQVFTGKITGLDMPGQGTREIDLLYVKLSLEKGAYNAIRSDKEQVCSVTLDQVKNYLPASPGDKPPLPCSVVYYIRGEKPEKKNQFPHNSTADIVYDEAQYQAYRDLGYYLVMTELRPKIMANAAGSGWLEQVKGGRLDRFRYFNELVRKAKIGAGVDNSKS